jgi:hypothetical protein
MAIFNQQGDFDVKFTFREDAFQRCQSLQRLRRRGRQF